MVIIGMSHHANRQFFYSSGDIAADDEDDDGRNDIRRIIHQEIIELTQGRNPFRNLVLDVSPDGAGSLDRIGSKIHRQYLLCTCI